MVVAISFARIHWQNLVNFGILPLVFINPRDYEAIHLLDVVALNDLPAILSYPVFAIKVNGHPILVRHMLSERQKEIITVGGLINWIKHHPA